MPASDSSFELSHRRPTWSSAAKWGTLRLPDTFTAIHDFRHPLKAPTRPATPAGRTTQVIAGSGSLVALAAAHKLWQLGAESLQSAPAGQAWH